MHTPGPWKVGYKNESGRYIEAPDGYVAVVHYWSRSDEEMEANARLIAAAPDLLEALIWMVENDDTNEGDEPVDLLGGESWNEYNAYWIDGLNRARSAIAKATGEG